MRARSSGDVRQKARYGPRALLRDAPEIFEIPTWPLGWILLGVAVLLAGKSLVTTGLGHLHLVIPVQGRVLASAGAIVILPHENEVIGTVLVRNGQEVRRGDVLLQVASTATAARIDRLQRERRDAWLDRMRLEAQLQGDPRALSPPADADPARVERARWLLASRMHAERAHVKRLAADVARERALRATIAANATLGEATLAQLERRIAVEEDLVRRKFHSEARLNRVRDEHAVEVRKQVNIAQRVAEADARIASATGMLSGAEGGFRTRTLAEHAAAAERFEAVTLALAQIRRGLQDLRAPTDGFVHGVAALADGDRVAAAQPLIRLFPADAEIEIEARLPSRDLPWIVEGQRVALRLAPPKGEGPVRVDGEITWIASDSVEDAQSGAMVPVRIRFARQSITNASLASVLAARAGTPISADIQLGLRSMIDLLAQTGLRQLTGGAVTAPLTQVGGAR